MLLCLLWLECVCFMQEAHKVLMTSLASTRGKPYGHEVNCGRDCLFCNPDVRCWPCQPNIVHHKRLSSSI